MKLKSVLTVALLFIVICTGVIYYSLFSNKPSIESRNRNIIETTPKQSDDSEVQSNYTQQSEESESVYEKSTSVGQDQVDSESAENTPNGESITESHQEQLIEIQGLIELEKLDNTFVIDLKYATADNFTRKKIYSISKCLIHKNTARKLIKANHEFKELGYRIKIFDAYRPYSAQQILWDAAENKAYVANPKKGSIHNRGAAVDITLVDDKGIELEMPSGYDEFSNRSHLDYKDCSEQKINNRELLGKIMVKHGFKRISKEWWHFEDTDAMSYPILDLPFESFIKNS